MNKKTPKQSFKTINSFIVFSLITVMFFSHHSLALNKNVYLYDQDGKLIEMSQSDGTIDYKYDLNGNVIGHFNDRNLLINSSFEVLKNQSAEVASNWATWKNSAELPSSSQLVKHPVDSGKRTESECKSTPRRESVVTISEGSIATGEINPSNGESRSGEFKGCTCINDH
ncbi:hypothetical protein NQ117_08645 [Paenibacillus sp. SC116]|uniref:hypothetical protein n=1 Tax=Paenibacillus sp. SC116 TaxID=2968986 RepID=UPI00215A7F91|nr:hypothetical protein [Paenibacillus sp. SC116]MCR8843754.1 hypothetical protein [Paenibacillus sp. SC116]